ncbi:MAG: nucleoside triphosphate pyrophosphohydrolase, partial [Pseudohongiellaceae bacterium]
MSRLDELLAIMAMLRDPEHGCPWDLQQNFQTIAPHTLEEVYEVVDTIDRQDYLHLKNELGDLLFQVVFYAQLGREQQLFGFDDIVSEIIDKLLQRHPHVFPDASMESFGRTSALTPGQVESNWEAIKSAERQQKSADSEADESEQASVMDDIPLAFPALTRARKIQKRAANLGFDWPDSTGVFAKLAEEIVELQQAVAGKRADDIADELGDLLFTIV